MIAAFIILSVMLCLLPVLMMLDGVFANGVVLAFDAIGMVTVALALQAGDLNRLSRLLRPSAILALFVPCVWMLLQVVPIPIRALANPIWASASAALDEPLVGAISLDIGATLLSLAHYCAGLAAAFMAAAVTLTKQRAESVLSLLTAVAALIAAELIAFDLGYLHMPGFERAQATDIAVFGFIMSCATTIRAYELLGTSIARQKNPQMTVKVAASVAVAAFFVCLTALLVSATTILLFAALFGAGILLSVLAIRRWRLGPWGRAGITAVAAVAAIGFFAIAPAKKDADPALALSAQGQNSAIERMLSDTKWMGSGAGSLQALAPIYRDTDDAASSEKPTAAATIAIEMGQPFLWASVVVLLMGASTLFRRALLRGRDNMYSSAGASCIIALLVSLSVNNGGLGPIASLIMGVVCGLAFAQSKSSGTRDLEFSKELYRFPDGANIRTAAEICR
jgi:hypothetical protein